MSFRISRAHDEIVIGIEGQLVAGNGHQLKQAVADELGRGAKKFLIDFADTAYVDSAGLGVLVSLSKRIRDAQGELRLANLNDDLRTLFELTKLDTLFRLDDRFDAQYENVEAPSSPASVDKRVRSEESSGEAHP